MASSLRISVARPSRTAIPQSVSTPGARSRFYHPELDSLRWWGFLAILTMHISPWKAALYQSFGLSPWGIELVLAIRRSLAFSLDMFFVLSAFLIATLLLREKETTQRVDVRSFYLRRILRIWPLYFTFVALICLGGLLHQSLRMQWYYAAAFFLLLGNVGWAIGASIPLPLIPLWSISVEEQFYLCLPLLVRRATKRGLIRLSIALVVVSAAARLMFAWHGASASAIWCNTLTRLDPFAAGIVMAVVLNGRAPRFTKPVRLALFSLGIAAWFVAAYWFPFLPEPIGPISASIAYPLGAAGSCAVVLSVLRDDARGVVLLTAPLFTYLGKISYGLYVTHQLFIDLSFRLFKMLAHNPSAPQDSMDSLLICYAATLAMTAACAMLSYRWLEAPFLRMKERITHVRSRPV